MQCKRLPRIGSEVMTAVRRAVTEVLISHSAAARVEVLVRLQPTLLGHARSVNIGVNAEDVDEREDDRLKADQEARFRALEL